MKSIFLVSLLEPDQEVDLAIKSVYPNAYQYNPTVYMVLDDCLAENVATKVRIKGDGRIPVRPVLL